MKRLLSTYIFCLFSFAILAQSNPVVDAIITEANENSQLEILAHELLDVIGPRLVGTPEMKQAHDWAVKKYAGWGISAENQQWGVWRGWQRGITHIDLVSPRKKTMEGMMLAWSPSSPKKGVTAEAIIIPDVPDSVAFANWLPNVKDKIVLISMNQPTGRPDYNWEEFATEVSFEKMKDDRDAETAAWRERLAKTGYNRRTLPEALERAGAAAVVQSYWSRGFGVNKIFGAYTREIPTVDLSLEDYGLVYRLAEYGNKPELNIVAESEELGEMPTFNTIATIPVTELPNDYIILSAHFESWDGGT